MTMSRLTQFRIADWDEQVRMLADPDTACEVEQWLGPAAFAELRGLAGGARHLSGGGKKNLIVVPGVMGSMLQSSGEAGIWWLDMLRTRDRLDSLALAPDGLQDLDPGIEVEPCAIDIIYAPMRKAIAHSGEFGGSIQFPYDWRKPLSASADRLRKLIHRIHSDYGEPVHLAGHSMGGLMIRTALMLHGDELWPKIGKIAFIATPHYGSSSIAGYLKNHLWGFEQLAVIGAFLSRDTFRTLWGVLSLLPAPAQVYPGTRNGEPHPCANFDLYDAAAYRLGLDAVATIRLQRALDAAHKFHADLFEWHRSGLSPSQRGKMLQITGVGRKTLFRLEVKPGWLGKWEDVERITSRMPGDPNREGDGRVPQASADLEKIEIRYVKGEHSSVQNLAAVVQDTIAWFTHKPLALPDSPEAALGGHLSAAEESSAPHLDGSAALSRHDDEYDRYRDFSEARVRELVAEWQDGKLLSVDLARIL
jgi:pimeloyl-ACP methyl ester carboxylesterase